MRTYLVSCMNFQLQQPACCCQPEALWRVSASAVILISVAFISLLYVLTLAATPHKLQSCRCCKCMLFTCLSCLVMHEQGRFTAAAARARARQQSRTRRAASGRLLQGERVHVHEAPHKAVAANAPHLKRLAAALDAKVGRHPSCLADVLDINCTAHDVYPIAADTL